MKKQEIYLVLDNVLDTYNIGSIFRLADAIVLSEGELEIITQAKKIISTEEHLKLQEQIRKEEPLPLAA